MRMSSRFLFGSILTLGAIFIQQANAGCLDVPRQKHASFQNSESFFAAARLKKVDYKQEENSSQAPIVGLWAFNYISGPGNEGIPPGVVVDGGNVLWFADGNEITYSAFRNPIVGATCLGIWKRTGENTYVLNHIGLSWNPQAPSSAPAGPDNPGGGPGAASGPAFIKQYIVLSADGQTYGGAFEITQLQTDGVTPAGPPIKGTIKATRVRIDTTTQPSTP